MLEALHLTIFTLKILPKSPLDLLVMPSKPSNKRLLNPKSFPDNSQDLHLCPSDPSSCNSRLRNLA